MNLVRHTYNTWVCPPVSVISYEPPFITGCNCIVKTRMGVVDRRNIDKTNPKLVVPW